MAGKANAVLPAFAFLAGCEERDGGAAVTLAGALFADQSAQRGVPEWRPQRT
jgi:hypothetical protein